MRRQKLAAVFFAAAMVLGLAASAGAVDGTLEINQAKVLAAGGGTYHAFGITASGSYRLTGNLTVPSGASGIVVNASNVTIDLNGFSMTGGGAGSSFGIFAAAAIVGTTVENGTVTGFNAGVSLGDSAIVKAVQVNSNSTSGIQVGNYSLVQGCTANNNGNDGIIVNGNGTLISGNAVNADSEFGISVTGNGIVISGNTVTGNAGGISDVGSGGLISGNTLYKNGGGIQTTDATTAYGGNVLDNNSLGNVSGGKSLGNNLCSGVVC